MILILDAAGSVLPEGLGFLKAGWWLIHVIAVVLVYAYGYRKGRRAERQERRARDAQAARARAESPGAERGA